MRKGWHLDKRQRPSLSIAVLAGAALNTFVYDGDGLRRVKEYSRGVRKFVWDGQNVLLETNQVGGTQVA